MPTTPRRPCPRWPCPHLQPCPTHLTGFRLLAQRSKAERGYGTAAWEPIRRRVLAAHPTCEQRVVLPVLWDVRQPVEYPGQTAARFGQQIRVCGEPATTVDHIVPKARGGTDDEENLQALCARCHHVKSGRESGRGLNGA